MRSNLTREVAFPWSPLTASLAQAVPRKIQAPESGRSAGTASSHLIYKARSASAQPLRLGPFGCRCREPQPPAGSCAGFSADDLTSPESNWGRRYLGREGVSDSSPTQSLRTPAAVQSRAGRQPRRPSGSRPSLAGCGSKRPGRPSPRSDPICARPAGRLGPLPTPTSGLQCPLPLPSGGPGEGRRWGVGTSAQCWDRDVGKTLPTKSPQSTFLV